MFWSLRNGLHSISLKIFLSLIATMIFRLYEIIKCANGLKGGYEDTLEFNLTELRE